MENLNNFNKELLPALKNGTRIPIGGVGCLVSIIVVILIPIGFLCL